MTEITTSSTTTPAGTTTLTTTPAPKPGWKTTEFYGAWAVKILGALMAGGIFGDGTTASRIAGAALTVLAFLGYTYSRTVVKTAGVLALVGLLAGSQTACATPAVLGTAALGAALNCELPELVPLVNELIPLATSVVLSAISPDGKHVDTTGLKKAWGQIKSDQGRCALATVIATIATPTTPQPGAPAAAGLVVDPGALHAAFSAIRVDHGWGPTSTSAGTL